GNRGSVEHDAVGEGVFVDRGDVGGDVLPFAARVGEAEIDVFHVVVLDHLHDVLRRSHGRRTLSWCWSIVTVAVWSTAGVRARRREARFRWRQARIPLS